ncbi:MAG: hypothetical protein ACO1N0_12670 [Fluviicola sp.]
MKLTALFITLTIVFSGCHNSNDDNQTSFNESKSEESKNNKKDIIPKGQIYTFRTAYFQSTGDTDFPEFSEQAVSKKFKNITIRFSSDSIYLNDFGLPIEREEPKISFFFRRKYEYNYYKSAFRIGYNEELGDKIQVLFADFHGDQSSEYWNYFFEGGYAIIKGQSLYLNFKRYVVQYSSEPLKKNELCKLPFDMWQNSRFCDYDNRETNGSFCDCNFPVYLLSKEPGLKSSLEKLIQDKDRTIKTIHKLNTGKGNPEIYIIIAQPIEESSGDYFIVIRDMKNKLHILEDPEDEFLHSKDFIISTELKITFYENAEYSPKSQVKSEFQIQPDGSYQKL